MVGASHGHALKDFPQFRKLPIELRKAIWDEHLASEPGRIVEVRWSKVDRRFFTDLKPPILLQVCHESRKAALAVYDILSLPVSVTNCNAIAKMLALVGSALPTPSPQPIIACFNTFINWKADVLYPSSYHLEHSDMGDVQPAKLIEFLKALNRDTDAAQKVQSIAFTAGTFDSRILAPGLFNMTNLKRLSFVYDDMCCFRERMFLDRSKRHRKAIGMTQIVFPELPPVQAAPTLQLVQVPDIASAFLGLPSQVYAYTRPSRVNPAHAHLSRAEKLALKCKPMWRRLNDQLLAWFNDNVTDLVELLGFVKARKDWSDLTTVPVFMVRDLLVT
ncbi:uncharacterized protein BP5553_02468 [Venustampulla echinocandica]|uniref:2EXR domain-containing protein n=1 Tax=Venustampulla echinocandica TaxID=2656787 RepID=A0A370U3Z0_9HELO|nr:uncharacterized protein BP5553_02468 [Venustampulla echinocandica]RDL42489.1 hypothetical protein BP5553_02468 [Venustampulla echinocandica]